METSRLVVMSRFPSSSLNKIEAAMKLKDVSQSPQSLLAERIAVEALAFYGH
jgi:hypothetical protein